jgi:hypothetical protein
MSVFANYLLRLLIRRELRRELLADLYRTINDEVSRAYAGSEAATNEFHERTNQSACRG